MLSIAPQPQQNTPGIPNAPQPGAPPPVTPQAPPQPGAPPPVAPQAPPQPAGTTEWGPIVVGLVGGLIALVGAIIPWTLIQSCVGAFGFEICLSVPLPISIGSIDPILGIAPLLALLTSLVGIVLLFLQKPITGVVSGVMGILALVFAILFVVNFSGAETDILAAVGGVTASLTVSVGIGVYITMVGGVILALGGFMQWSKLKKTAASAPAAPPQ